MPQLNPAPWFLTMLLTWTVLILLINKTLNFKYPNTPVTKDPETKTTPWSWPWY